MDATQLGQLGMARAADAQDRVRRGWTTEALDVIRLVAEQQATVHVDDVAKAADELGLDKPDHTNAWGMIWRTAVTKGWLVRTGEVRGAGTTYKAHKHKHARSYPVYRSTLYRAPKAARRGSPVEGQHSLLGVP